jgi:hypothetical protein
MSYEGGGGAQGPAGPTGPTGATGGDFSGPNGAVLWYDGTGVTGTTEFTWTQTGGIGGNASILTAGLNGNYFNMDAPGSMEIAINQINDGNAILLSAGATRITLTDDVTGESGLTGTLQLQISGNNGASGNVLTSDGTYATWQPPVGLTEGILDLFTNVTWTSDGPGYYSDFTLSQPVYSNSNVQVTLINTDVNLAANCWIINVTPDANGENDLRIWLAGDPNSDIYASYLIANPGITPPV